MKTIDEIRRENLRQYADHLGGVAKLAACLQKSHAQTSQWLNGSKDSKTKKPRGMSDESARLIETKLGQPRGWLDQEHRTTIQEEVANYALSPITLDTIGEALNAIDQAIADIESAWQTTAKKGLRSHILRLVLQEPHKQLWRDSQTLTALLTTHQAIL